jgi:Skp family chaperone for outer membrane proteins
MVLTPRLLPLFGLALLAGLWSAPTCPGAEDDADRVAGLAKALQDDHALVRKHAALALERLGPKALEARAALEKALHDRDADVRDAAAAALVRVAPPRSVEALLRRVEDKGAGAKERAEACNELAEHFWQDPAVTRALERALTDPVINVDAARGLEMIDGRLKRKAGAGSGHGTRIAILNLKSVVMNYKKWQDFTAELKREYAKYEERIQPLNAKLEAINKQLQSTPFDEKADLEKQAKNLQREVSDLADEAKNKLGKKESDELVVIYREITEAAATYARDNDIQLVLHFNDAVTPEEMNSSQNIGRKMVTGPLTPLIIRPGDIDITVAIQERLNDRYTGPARRSEDK